MTGAPPPPRRPETPPRDSLPLHRPSPPQVPARLPPRTRPRRRSRGPGRRGSGGRWRCGGVAVGGEGNGQSGGGRRDGREDGGGGSQPPPLQPPWCSTGG